MFGVKHPFDRLAFLFLLIIIVLLSLSRIAPTDTAWHLTTARQFYENGTWLTTNTFSYTHTDYPLYQQYTLYQSLIYFVWEVFWL